MCRTYLVLIEAHGVKGFAILKLMCAFKKKILSVTFSLRGHCKISFDKNPALEMDTIQVCSLNR